VLAPLTKYALFLGLLWLGSCGGGGGGSKGGGGQRGPVSALAPAVIIAPAAGAEDFVDPGFEAHSDYFHDPLREEVEDPSLVGMRRINAILDATDRSGSDALVDAGAYGALQRLDADAPGADTNAARRVAGFSTGWAVPSFELWTVERTRPAEGAQDYNAWIPTLDSFEGPLNLALRARFTRDVSANYPFGKVDLNYSAGADPAGFGAQVFQGFLNSFGGSSGAGFSYYERRGDVGLVPSVGERFDEVQARVELEAGGLQGSGRVFRRVREDTGSGDGGILAEEWLLAFDETHLLRAMNGGASVAFELAAPTRQVWRYGLYAAPGAGGGSRFYPSTGFGVRDPGGVYGWYEAGCLWMSDGSQVASGTLLERDLFLQTEALSYSAFAAPGRLLRMQRQPLDLTRIAGDRFQWLEYNAAGPSTMLHEVSYNMGAGNWRRVASFDADLERFVELDPVQLIDVAALGALYLHSEALAGPVSFVDGASEVAWYEGEIVDGADAVFEGGATELELFGYVDALRAEISSAQAASGDIFLPDALNVGSAHRYVFRRSDFSLQYDASGVGASSEPVALASGAGSAGGPYAWGMRSGPLLPAGVLPGSPAEAWNASVVYLWETGPNPWNGLVGLEQVGGDFLDIPAPVRFEYVHSSAGDRNGEASEAGRTFVLEWSTSSGVRGIPRRGIDQDGDGDLDRFLPIFNLKDGLSIGPSGDPKVVRGLLVEELLRVDAAYTGSLSLFAAGDLVVPNLSGFVDPGLGAAPVVGEAPRVVDAQED
jgi:hypothetical protein